MSDDETLERAIQQALALDARLGQSNIQVRVHGGAVTLTGTVLHTAERWIAAEIAGQFDDVHAVANEVKVHRVLEPEPRDSDLADAVAGALERCASDGRHLVGVVSDGWVTLRGAVCGEDSKTRAEAMIGALEGVTGVVNNLTVGARPIAASSAAQHRSHCLVCGASELVYIAVEKGHATLTGAVGAPQTRNDAACAAWSAPGVTAVHNRVTVASDEGVA